MSRMDENAIKDFLSNTQAYERAPLLRPIIQSLIGINMRANIVSEILPGAPKELIYDQYKGADIVINKGMSRSVRPQGAQEIIHASLFMKIFLTKYDGLVQKMDD